MSKKDKKRKDYNQGPKRPEKFGSLLECLKWTKKCVYSISRGRKKGEEVQWRPIGTGFLSAPNRMLTCAHVIDDKLGDPENKNELSHHKSGDVYYLIRHDDEHNWHRYITPLELGKDLFLYEKEDLAIIELNNDFYGDGDRQFADRNDFIRINQDYLTIGTEVSVLGYPLIELSFEGRDVNKPILGNILMRVDTGVINCRYETDSKLSFYEFTMAFNPGNSGGPIFDTRNGRLVSVVQGYKSRPIRILEKKLPEHFEKKDYASNSYIETLNANYSVGVASNCFVEILKKHNII